MKAISVAFLLMIGCGSEGSGPGSQEAAVYIELMTPLIHENRLLADQVLQTAADLHNGETKNEDALERWNKDIIPLANHLFHESAILRTPPEWSEKHGVLIDIWETRSKAYEEIAQAIERGDRAVWERAKTHSGQAKIREESWFNETNKTLSPMSLRLSPYH